MAGTTTPDVSYPTYDDAIAGTNANANPVVLDFAGRANIYVQGGRFYHILVQTSALVTVDDQDDVNPANGFGTPAADQWVTHPTAPTFNTTVLFTQPGNTTDVWVKGRRIRAFQTSGTVYGTVADATGVGPTTIRVVLEGGAVLDSGLNRVDYGLLTPSYQGTVPPALNDRQTWVNAYRAANQALTLAIWNKIVFDTEFQDNLNEWDNSANSRFTPVHQSSASYFQRWRIQAQITFDTNIASAQVGIALNGTTPPAVTIKAENQGIAGSVIEVDYTIVAPALTGQFWEVWVNPIANVNARGGAAATWIQISRLPN
jgi:hypothetical protein